MQVSIKVTLRLLTTFQAQFALPVATPNIPLLLYHYRVSSTANCILSSLTLPYSSSQPADSTTYIDVCKI